MWAWVLPLVLVVVALAWFIFSEGQPRSPFGSIRAPTVEPARPAPTTEIRIEAPEVRLPSPTPGNEAPAAAPAEPAGEPSGAAAPAEP
jgi:hypothetical protein